MRPQSILFILLMPLLVGCTPLGYAASAIGGSSSDEPPVARYNGLAGQTCAIMVWADRSVRADFFNIRDDVGRILQEKIVNEGQGILKRDELKDTKFPFAARSVVRFQDDHPEIEMLPAKDAALRLGIPNLTRVIYVQIEAFQTRYEKSRDLFRGSATASIKVIEIAGNTAKEVFHEDDIKILFPEKGGDAQPGSDKVNDEYIYWGTIGELDYAIARRFYEMAPK